MVQVPRSARFSLLRREAACRLTNPVTTPTIRHQPGLHLSAGIFAAVLLIRVLVLARIADSPFLMPHTGDMHFYNDWARRILAGQAGDHLAFYGLPGYAWLLAILYKIFGYNPFVPLLVQSALDAGTAVLIYKIASRTFAREGEQFANITGLLAAAGWTFFVPAQSYAAILMPTAWIVFVFWLVLWLIIRSPLSLYGILALGLLIGLSATVVATVLFLVPLIVSAIFFGPTSTKLSNKKWMFRISALTALVLGVGLGTAPCWVHNYFVAHDPVFLSAHSGINFWIGNNPAANGYPHFPPGLRAGQAALLQDSIAAAESAVGHPLKRADVSAYWSEQAWRLMTERPLAWCTLLLLKMRNFWNAFQYDDLSIVTILREQQITFPGIYFGLASALALPGLILAWKRVPLSRWIAAAIFLQMLALLPVFVTERYRLAAVPGLLIFAAAGIVFFWQSLKTHHAATSLIYACLLLVSAIFVSWPQRESSLWALDFYNSGVQALDVGDLALATKKLEVAYTYVPENAETNFALGNLSYAKGDLAEAKSKYQTAFALDHRHTGALNNLGVIALQEHDWSAAEDVFRASLGIDSRSARSHFFLAKTLLAKSDRGAAQREIALALELAPDEPAYRTFSAQIQ